MGENMNFIKNFFRNFIGGLSVDKIISMGRFLISVIILSCCFYATPNVAFGDPKIYFTNNRSFLRQAAVLRRSGRSIDEIINLMLTHDVMQELTPELAQQEFHFVLRPGRDNDDGGSSPRLIIINTGEEARFGLFTFDPIRNGRAVIEYTGEVVRFGDRETNPYMTNIVDLGMVVDAQREGNAARFVQHLPPDAALAGVDAYQQDDINVRYLFRAQYMAQDVATANLRTQAYPNNTVFLFATRDIEPFEQLGFDYGLSYCWQEEPRLFYRNGDVIPIDLYNIINRLLVMTCRDEHGRAEYTETGLQINRARVLDPAGVRYLEGLIRGAGNANNVMIPYNMPPQLGFIEVQREALNRLLPQQRTALFLPGIYHAYNC